MSLLEHTQQSTTFRAVDLLPLAQTPFVKPEAGSGPFHCEPAGPPPSCSPASRRPLAAGIALVIARWAGSSCAE